MTETARKPLWARRVPLEVEEAATRTTAYVYGNILVLAVLVALPPEDVDSGKAFWIVIGTAFSTFLAHVFAEGMGALVRRPVPVTLRTVVELSRESRPVLTSGLMPAAILALGWLHTIPADPALAIAEAIVLVRIAVTGIVVARLRNEPSSARILLVGVVAAVVGALLSVLKAYLTH